VPEPSSTSPITAAANMLGAMFVIGLIDIYVVVIAETISVWQFLVVRLMISAPIIAALSYFGFGTLRPKRLGAVAFRSLLISSAMCFYFGALAFMPIAMALAGLFTSPIFVLLITALVLRHSIGPWRIFAVALGFGGILVVLGPSSNSLGWVLVMPVAGAVLYAGGVIATRSLCAGESTLTLLLGIFVAQAVLGALALSVMPILFDQDLDGPGAFLTRGWVWPMTEAMPYVVLQGVGAVLGVGLLNRAYQLGEASYVSIFEYSVMIFGPLFAFVLLGQPVTMWHALGIVMIVAAGCVIAVRSRQAASDVVQG